MEVLQIKDFAIGLHNLLISADRYGFSIYLMVPEAATAAFFYNQAGDISILPLSNQLLLNFTNGTAHNLVAY